MTHESLAAVVLCAGQGKRLKSRRAKVLHQIMGRPLGWYPITRAFEAGITRVVAVVGFEAEAVSKELHRHFPDGRLATAIQAEQRGTGNAVESARAALTDFSGNILVLNGDLPLITSATLAQLIAQHARARVPLSLVTSQLHPPNSYGKVVRDASGAVAKIVEDGDATEAERQLTEVNVGVYLADAKFLFDAVSKLTPNNVQGETYLTDVVAMAAHQGGVSTVDAPAVESLSVNTRADLARATEAMRARINAAIMDRGVTVEHPPSTLIDEETEIGPETVIGPTVSIQGHCEIGSDVTIGRGCVLHHSTIGDGTTILPYTLIDNAVIGPGCQLGPFARLRPGTVLDAEVRVGSFVETKQAHLRRGSKVNHLAYLGDAEIGARCNIGAGTITCNYDGESKHVTTLGDDVFVGSDSQFVAPVTVGDGAYIGAGSTIVSDVPAGALAIARSRQVIKSDWALKRRKRR